MDELSAGRYTFRGINFHNVWLPSEKAIYPKSMGGGGGGGANSFLFEYTPSEKGSTLKEKKLLQKGNKFLPFRADPFSEGDLCAT